MRIFSTSAALALIAGGAMAQAVDSTRVEVFRGVLQSNNCTLSESAAAEILPRFDFTRVEARAIVGVMVAAGDVELDGNTLNLVDGSCDNSAVAGLLGQAGVQQFIAVMAENNCAMTEAEGETIFTARGVTKAEVGAIVRPMMQAGMASFENGILSVDSAYCSPSVVVAGTATTSMETPELDRSGMFGLGRVRGLVDAMVQNGCQLNTVVEDSYLADAGIEFGFASFIARKMLRDGYATMIDEENLVLSAPYCVPAAGAAPALAEEPPVEGAGVDMAMVATLREIFLANNCRLNEDQMSALLPPAGFTRDNIKPIFGYLEDMGEMGEDGSDLVLYNAACAPALAEEPAVEDAGVDMEQVDLMRQIFAENGCRLSEARMGELLPAAGFSRASAGAVFNYLEANGELSDVDNDAVLTGDYCAEAQVGASAPASVMVENDGALLGAFLSVAAQNGCALNVAVAQGPLAEAGLRMDQAYLLVDDLVLEGNASLSDGGTLVRINPALCGGEMQPAAPVENSDDPRAAVLAMLTANGCTITQAGAADMIAAAGLDFVTSMRVLTQMMSSGEAISPDGGQTLNIAAPLCVAAGVEPMTPREAFIDLLKQNNCSVTAAEFGNLLPVDGLDAPTAFGMISELEAEGVISLPATRDVVTLSAEMCR